MRGHNRLGAQIVVFGLTVLIVPASAFVAQASIAAMQFVRMDAYHLPLDELPTVTAVFVRLGWAGFAAIAIAAILASGILTFKFNREWTLALSCAIVVLAFGFCMVAVLASLMPYPWWCGSMTVL